MCDSQPVYKMGAQLIYTLRILFINKLKSAKKKKKKLISKI